MQVLKATIQGNWPWASAAKPGVLQGRPTWARKRRILKCAA